MFVTAIDKLIQTIRQMAKQLRFHTLAPINQPATPTTLGKICKCSRAKKQTEIISKLNNGEKQWCRETIMHTRLPTQRSTGNASQAIRDKS